LRRSLRTSDSAFRLGGDEFVLLLPQTDAPQAFALIKRIGFVFSDVLRSIDVSVDVSMDHGISTFPSDGDAWICLFVSPTSAFIAGSTGITTRPGAKRTSATVAPGFDSASFTSIHHVGRTERRAAAFDPACTITGVSGSRHCSRRTHRDAAPAPRLRVLSPLQFPPSSLRLQTPVAVRTPGLESRPSYAVQRKAERVSMTGTNAYAVLGEQSPRRAKVLDLGFVASRSKSKTISRFQTLSSRFFTSDTPPCPPSI